MKISEVIHRLAEIQNAEGDIDVYASSECAIGKVTDIRSSYCESEQIVVIDDEHS